MENNMNKLEIEKQIEKIFIENKIIYRKLPIDDNDLNYFIQIPAIGDLKPLKRIHAYFYADFDDNTINLIIPNVYKISDKDDISYILEIINKTNLKNAVGLFAITEGEESQIIYRDDVNCGENFCNLSNKLVMAQFALFTTQLSYLFEQLDKGNKKHGD